MPEDTLPLDNGALPEFEDAIAPEPPRYTIGDQEFVVYRDRLWRRIGSTRNPRRIASADAVTWEGCLLTVHAGGRIVELQHPVAGVELRLLASRRTAVAFELFEEVPTDGDC